MKPLTLLILVALLAQYIGSTAADLSPAQISALSYQEMKDLFEKDETSNDMKVTSFSATEVVILYKGRHLSYTIAKLPETLKAKVDKLIAIEKDRRRDQQTKDYAEASRLGMLREVDGVVYNLMKPTADWATFSNVRVFQKTDEGMLIDIGSQNYYELNLIFVKNLPQLAADNDRVTFQAKQTGTYTYITRGKVDKTVRQYDCGVMPGKSVRPSLVKTPNERRGTSALDPSWDSSGTGFFITEDGYIATCNHVVDGGKRFSVRTTIGTLNANLVATDSSNDVAILKVAGKFAALFINTNSLSLGVSAFTIGYPNINLQGLAPKYTDGRISSLTGLHDDSTAMQISVPVQPGNSGGPLTDDNGHVIGLVVARLNDYSALKHTHSIPQNVNYAVKSEPLVNLVQKAGLRTKVHFANAPRKHEDAVKAVQDATALILVSE